MRLCKCLNCFLKTYNKQLNQYCLYFILLCYQKKVLKDCSGCGSCLTTKKRGLVTGQPVFVSGQKMDSGRVRNTTKNVSFSCVFLSGVYKNVAIEWL